MPLIFNLIQTATSTDKIDAESIAEHEFNITVKTFKEIIPYPVETCVVLFKFEIVLLV